MDGAACEEIGHACSELVNMAPAELEKWLASDQSRGAGQHKGVLDRAARAAAPSASAAPR
ncbi:DUF3140 domain-containing protein [Streptomyces sp. NPDC047813]|uniref:DUF3140 domain-containing protein n=1 Tax=Streptomyces sp. NPDC047813 TaxID=3154608 RepID=UPI0033F53BAF